MDPEEELQKVAGIGAATAKKLVAAGYTTIEAVARASPEELREVVGERGKALIAAAKKKLEEEIPEKAEIVAEPVGVEEGEKIPEEVETRERNMGKRRTRIHA